VKQRVLRAVAACLFLSASLTVAFFKPAFLSITVQAKSSFMDRYNRDQFAKASLRNKCTICHVGRGGAQRNDFGDAFEDAGYRITPKLREKFPELFSTRDP